MKLNSYVPRGSDVRPSSQSAENSVATQQDDSDSLKLEPAIKPRIPQTVPIREEDLADSENADEEGEDDDETDDDFSPYASSDIEQADPEYSSQFSQAAQGVVGEANKQALNVARSEFRQFYWLSWAFLPVLNLFLWDIYILLGLVLDGKIFQLMGKVEKWVNIVATFLVILIIGGIVFMTLCSGYTGWVAQTVAYLKGVDLSFCKTLPSSMTNSLTNITQ